MTALAPQVIRDLAKQRRRELGLSQAELASRLGRSRKWVADFESGRSDPGFFTVLSAFDALSMSPTFTGVPAIRTAGASRVGSDAHPNQDAFGLTSDAAWVIDGATRPVEHPAIDTVTFVEKLSQHIRSEIGRSEGSLASVLERAIAAVNGPPGGPSATVALARRNERGYEWLVLGDAAIIASPAGEAVAISDTRIERVAVDERAARLRAIREGQPEAETHHLSAELVRAELRARNVAGGYWVAADLPQAARHAIQGWYPHSAGPILLATDGFADAVGIDGGAWSDWGLARTVASESPEQAVRDAHRALSTRGRPDDITVAVLT